MINQTDQPENDVVSTTLNAFLSRRSSIWLESQYLFPDTVVSKKLTDFSNNFQELLTQSSSSENQLEANEKKEIVKNYIKVIADICSKLGKVNRAREKNYNKCSLNIFYEAKLREDMIKCILEVYAKYLKEMSSHEKKRNKFVLNFAKNIYTNVTINFFDNLFCLLENVELSEEKLKIFWNLAKELYNYREPFPRNIIELYTEYLKCDFNSYKLKEEKNEIFITFIDFDCFFKKYMPDIYKHLLLSQLHRMFLEIRREIKLSDDLDELKLPLMIERCVQITKKILAEEDKALRLRYETEILLVRMNSIMKITMKKSLRNIIMKKSISKEHIMTHIPYMDKLIGALNKDIETCERDIFESSTEFDSSAEVKLKFVEELLTSKSSGTKRKRKTAFKKNIAQRYKETYCEEDRDHEENTVHYEKTIDCSKQLRLLSERIENLETLLINTDKNISKQWDAKNDPENDLCLRYRITHLYLNEPGIQAASEMLLYNCMDLLRTEDLVNLWSRTASAFNTANVRNTFVKRVSSLISPLDIFSSANDFVKKCIELIVDKPTIDKMAYILEHADVDYRGFMDIMDGGYDEDFEKLKDEILSCDRWRDYTLLIPLKDSCDESSFTDSKIPS